DLEKAHPDVFNLLLQVLDDGRLTDSQGRTVDFRNTVVIMTSNIGSQRILDRSGNVDPRSGAPDQALRDDLMRDLRQQFRPEFLNRIDELIVFHALTRKDLVSVVDLLLERTRRRLRAQDVRLDVTEAAKEFLVNRGYQPEFGARPLRRTIQSELDNRISNLLLDGTVREGDTLIADVSDGELVVTLARPEPSATFEQAEERAQAAAEGA
ncbi:MAG TPA: AAA family ATPase, partial [Kitasatospora aureofaciens]|uniref:AAA family ATPase n=1 Tax=Kitasatospora aureofaciens TaxID=1894 RepID=UPI001D3830EE